MFIDGTSMVTAPGKARCKISVCPQDNPLIKGYTVEEHLKFFDSARNASGRARDPSCYLKY